MRRKVSKIDYSKASLPRSRKVQFFDCFKMNYLLIFKCGLMLLLFFVPMIAFSFFADFYYVSLMSNAVEEIEQTQLVYDYLLNIGLILFSFIALIGITGVIYVLRNFIWGEGIFFASDFARGIKQNGGKNIAFAAIFSLFYALAFFIFSLFPDAIISLIPIIIFAFIFLPVYFWIILLNNFYSSKWKDLFRNGLFFFIRTIGWSLLGSLMLILLVGLLFIPFEFIWIKYIVLIAYIVFLLPIILLVMVLYSTSIFDEYINKDNYLDYYLRGLNHD